MAVNVVGPIRLVELFVDNVAMSEQKKIMNISSLVGSIQMTFPGQNFYRASKAALNMSMKTIAKELRGSKEPGRKEIIVGLIHPGVVATDFAKNVPIPMISPQESAAAVITVIDGYYQNTRVRNCPGNRYIRPVTLVSVGPDSSASLVAEVSA